MVALYYFGVFIAMVVVDFFYAEYVKATSDRKSIKASLMATGIILTTGFVTTSYIKDPYLLIPAALGAFFGTWLSIRFLK